MHRLLVAATFALALSTVPVFAQSIEENQQNYLANLERARLANQACFEGHTKLLQKMALVDQKGRVRVLEAVEMVDSLIPKHVDNATNGLPIPDPNDPNDMSCDEAVKLAIDYVDGKIK